MRHFRQFLMMFSRKLGFRYTGFSETAIDVRERAGIVGPALSPCISRRGRGGSGCRVSRGSTSRSHHAGARRIPPKRRRVLGVSVLRRMDEDMTLDVVKDAALQLLQEMSEHQAKWKEGAVVHPSAAAHAVGLAPDTPLCNAAVKYLKREGALAQHELGTVSRGDTYGYSRITHRGLDMTRRRELP